MSKLDSIVMYGGGRLVLNLKGRKNGLLFIFSSQLGWAAVADIAMDMNGGVCVRKKQTLISNPGQPL